MKIKCYLCEKSIEEKNAIAMYDEETTFFSDKEEETTTLNTYHFCSEKCEIIHNIMQHILLYQMPIKPALKHIIEDHNHDSYKVTKIFNEQCTGCGQTLKQFIEKELQYREFKERLQYEQFIEQEQQRQKEQDDFIRRAKK